MQIYLPIAEVSVDLYLLIALGGGVGIVSGLFGVGGGFLITPLLILIGIAPAVAVGTGAKQVAGASVSGVLVHWRRRTVGVKRRRGLVRVGGAARCAGGWWVRGERKKAEAILVRAEDDRAGVTAAFNLKIIERSNRELGGDFDPRAFRYMVLYNGEKGRIEMHLVSRKDQTVTIQDRAFRFRDGETIHTENSYKYHVEEFTALAGQAGFNPVRTWVDGDGLFSLHYLTVD